MIRLRLPALLACFLLSGGVCLRAAAPPDVYGKAAILVDVRSGRVLYNKNSRAPRAVASTQKLLTALIVAEEGNLWQNVTIKPSDTTAAPTKLYLKSGQTYSRFELLQALLVKSANDVACALARDNAGSVEAFAAKMNRRAAQLGAKASHFINPNGLPADGQHSTARDMAIIARNAYAHPVLRRIVATKSFEFHFADGRVRELVNTNRVLRTASFCNGMKTGYTNAAGHCLVSSGQNNGRDVIAVVLGSNKKHVWDDSRKLLEWGLKL
ncbi:MAG: D-alanyl-D-alanine carboxypeptidase family protein [Chthoniobacterales bacterium]|jgi:D-alanyl-D-alanine carboxypeptidase (penicillin-binding protein 5/6)